jgi:peptidyl-prolyl cis-trans isomerase C
MVPVVQVRRRAIVLTAVSVLASIAIACSDDGEAVTPEPEAELHHGLTEEQAGQQLAKIGDRVITVGEFADEIASKGPFLRARYNSPERRRELLDQMIRFELLAKAAEDEDFDQLPEVQRTRKQILIRRFLKREYEDRIQLSDVSDDDVRAYYEAHHDEFNKPEQVRASHVFFASRAAAERVLRQLLASPTDVRLFRELAERHNEDPETRDRFGDLRFFSRPEERQAGEPDVPPEVARAAFAIAAIGGIHESVVESERGFHIVKLTGRRAALHRTLEEASRPIRHRLWRERREQAVEELVERLRSAADVEEDLSLLSEVHVAVPEGAFPTETGLPTPETAPPTAPQIVQPPRPGTTPPGTALPGTRPPRRGAASPTAPTAPSSPTAPTAPTSPPEAP